MSNVIPLRRKTDEDTNIPLSKEIGTVDERTAIYDSDQLNNIIIKARDVFNDGLGEIAIVSPMALYQVEEKDASNIIVLIYDILTKAKDYLSRAKSIKDDVMESSISLDLFRDCINRLILLPEPNQNFLDVLTAVYMATENKKTDIMSYDEITVLFSVINKMMNNIITDDRTLEECLIKLYKEFNITINIPNELDFADE
jgi:hypothetical protein